MYHVCNFANQINLGTTSNILEIFRLRFFDKSDLNSDYKLIIFFSDFGVNCHVRIKLLQNSYMFSNIISRDIRPIICAIY